MKILLFFSLFIVCAIRVNSQSTLPLRADTILVQKVGGNANLKLQDASRDSLGGIYVNIGGGVLRAIKTKKINDTTYIIGLDTIHVGNGANSTAFASLTDVTVSSPKNGQIPVYDSITSKWINRSPVYINVKDYGAKGDSTTDDRAAIIKARSIAYLLGGVLFFPAGKYRISDSIIFQYPVRIQGVGKSGGLHNYQDGGALEKNRLGPIQTSTEIVVTNGKNGFVFDRQANETKAQFTVENISMSSTVAPGSTTGGAFIVIRGMLQGCQILNSTFYGGYIQVLIESGYYQLIQGCHFSAPQIACIKTGNNIRHDTGDFTVTACTFSSGTFNRTDTTKAIWWFSGGGMRIINNKFDACEFNNNSNFYYHIYAANIEEETSDFIISLNSFENSWSSAIHLRGIVPNYVRNIQITDNQFAPVGSIDPAIDIDKMEAVVIDGFAIRDWGHTVSAPAIRVTNSIDVTIGKGSWRDYSSFVDITGTTNWHTDYMHGGDVAIGNRNITNIAGVDASLYTTMTILGRSQSGLYGAGILEVGSQLPDANGSDIGYLDFSDKTSGHRAAYIGVVSDGTTVNNRGGKLSIGIKQDGGFVREAITVDNSGHPAFKYVDSVGVQTGGCTFIDASTGELRKGPCGVDSIDYSRIKNKPNLQNPGVYFGPAQSFDPTFVVFASAIVYPTNSFSHGVDISWGILDHTSGHNSSFYDTVYGSASTGRLVIGYPNVKAVLNSKLLPDETLSGQLLITGPTVGFSTLEAPVYQGRSIGIRLTGDGSGNWTKSTDYNGSSAWDVTTFNTGDGGTSFNIGSPMMLVGYNELNIQYIGPNGYSIKRVYSGLGMYNVRFILQDAFGNPVTTNPTTSDEIVITNGGMQARFVSMRTYQAGMNDFLVSGSNWWVDGSFECWLVAAPTSTTSTLVRWQTNYPSATNYKIYRSTTKYGTRTLIHTGTDGAYTDSGLSSGTLYFYHLVAVIGGVDTYITYFTTNTQ